MNREVAHVRLEARPHGVALVRPLARALAVMAVGAVLVIAGTPRAWPLGAFGAVLLTLAALAVLRAVVAWDRTRVVVTDDELVIVHGLLRRRAAAVRLGRSEAVEIEQSLPGRLLGYGTIVAGELEVPYVPDARRLARCI